MGSLGSSVTYSRRGFQFYRQCFIKTKTKMSNSELATNDEGKLIYTTDDMSINLYQPLFYALAPIAIALLLWQLISPSSSKYLGHFASRFFGAGYSHPQTDSYDYGPTGPSSGHGGPYARLRARLEALENGGDYKDFYKSGKKEDFASYDEY